MFSEDFMVVECSSKETVHHALVGCEVATAAWNRSSVDVRGGSATFSSWLLLLFGRGRVSEMEEAAVVSWATSNIVASAKNMLDQYKCAQGRKGLSLSPLNEGGDILSIGMHLCYIRSKLMLMGLCLIKRVGLIWVA
ncbi:hypothetical protein CsatB_005766 [Cannabis sativa]